MSDPGPSWFARFGDFELDTRTGEVCRGGRRLGLAGQPIQLLELFLRRPGQMVTLDELRRALWPGDVHVDFEHGLRAVVRRLRAALGDTADEPKWIETIPRKGYRYIGPEPEWTGAPVPRERRRLPYRAAAAVCGVAIVLIGWIAFGTAGTGTRKRVVAVLTLDNLTGDPAHAAFCETLTEEIISRLAQMDPNRLGVIARAESQKFRDVTQLTYALRVDFIVEGGVVRQDGGLRLNARLIRIQDRTQVWASSFDVDASRPAAAAVDVVTTVSTSVQWALTR